MADLGTASWSSFHRRLRDPARQLGRLPDPTRHELLVESVVLMDVEVAHLFGVGLAGRDREQRRAAEEGQLYVLRKTMEVEEPALALDAIEGRVPLHSL